MKPEGLGTVVVTGADGQMGRALLRTLAETGARTIALVRRPAYLPASRVIAGAPDGAEATAAIRDADYVVHLAGTLRPGAGNSYEAANVRTAEAVAGALAASRARRALFLSYVGARDGDDNAYLRTKAAAERALAASGRPMVVFRCTHIIGSPDAPGATAEALIARPGGSARVLGDGRQMVAPVYRDDVVAALVAAMRGGAPGTYELAGPERMSMDDLVRLVNRSPGIAIAHLPAWLARLLGMFMPSLPGPLVDVMLRDSIGNPARAVVEFGLTLTPLSAIWTPRAAGTRPAAAPARG